MPMFRGGLQMPSFTALHLPSEAVSLLSLELVGLTELTEQQTPQDLSVSASLTSGLYVFFYVDAENPAQVFMLAQEAFYQMSHLPNSSPNL